MILESQSIIRRRRARSRRQRQRGELTTHFIFFTFFPATLDHLLIVHQVVISESMGVVMENVELHDVSSPAAPDNNTRNGNTSLFSDLCGNDPVFDPKSDKFDPFKYGQRLIRAQYAQGISVPHIGIAFQDLSVSGSGSTFKYQSNMLSPFDIFTIAAKFLRRRKRAPKTILDGFDGLLDSGELLLVLGRPGSGCTTFLKAISGQTHGFTISKESNIKYSGISRQRMAKEFRGHVVYNPEVDQHFPHLTVSQTLEFAAASRAPQLRVDSVKRMEYIKTATEVTMAIFGLSHTSNTKVGNDFVHGVSGGERKRVRYVGLSSTTKSLANIRG